jgi:hypothetical protein
LGRVRVTPENIALTGPKDFSYRLVRLVQKVNKFRDNPKLFSYFGQQCLSIMDLFLKK